jgi:hypothetical protein
LACTDSTGPLRGAATVQFDIGGADFVRTVSIQVSGPGIDSTLVFNIAVDSTGHGSGSARIPAGSNRHIVGLAFDSTGVNTNRGDTTLTLVEGNNPPVALTLAPLTGNQPIVISIGTSRIQVQPGDTTIHVADTVAFVATVRDTNGVIVPGAAVVWASTNPAAVTVDSVGRAVGQSTGAAVLFAISGAYAARTLVTVVP